MKPIALLFVIVLSSAFAGNTYALELSSKERDGLVCYGYSMVGFDSVVNSRLGVPVEFVMGLAIKNSVSASEEERYSTNLLKMVLNAYMWAGTPHEYSLQVFDRCARAQGNYLDANLD